MANPKTTHAAELDEALAAASCPVEVIPPGVSGLAAANLVGTRWAWLLRPMMPERARVALASHRGPWSALGPGCAHIVALNGCDRQDDW